MKTVEDDIDKILAGFEVFCFGDCEEYGLDCNAT